MLRHACGFKLANDGHDTRALRAYISGIRIFNTPCATPNCRKDFGAIERAGATCRVRQLPTRAVHAWPISLQCNDLSLSGDKANSPVWFAGRVYEFTA